MNDNRYYTGITNDLERRLKEHDTGKTHSIRRKGKYKLVYSEKYETRKKAREREVFFKSGQGRELRDQIIMGR